MIQTRNQYAGSGTECRLTESARFDRPVPMITLWHMFRRNWCRMTSGTLLTALGDFSVTFPGYYLYYTSLLKSSAAFNIIVESLRMSDSPR